MHESEIRIRIRLDEERDDGLPSPRVIGELLPVIPVFSLRPNGHLGKTNKGEKSSNHAEGDQVEGNPGKNFKGVVGAGNLKIGLDSEWEKKKEKKLVKKPENSQQQQGEKEAHGTHYFLIN